MGPGGTRGVGRAMFFRLSTWCCKGSTMRAFGVVFIDPRAIFFEHWHRECDQLGHLSAQFEELQYSMVHIYKLMRGCRGFSSFIDFIDFPEF
jgi:hypothetical protein